MFIAVFLLPVPFIEFKKKKNSGRSGFKTGAGGPGLLNLFFPFFFFSSPSTNTFTFQADIPPCVRTCSKSEMTDTPLVCVPAWNVAGPTRVRFSPRLTCYITVARHPTALI